MNKSPSESVSKQVPPIPGNHAEFILECGFHKSTFSLIRLLAGNNSLTWKEFWTPNHSMPDKNCRRKLTSSYLLLYSWPLGTFMCANTHAQEHHPPSWRPSIARLNFSLYLVTSVVCCYWQQEVIPTLELYGFMLKSLSTYTLNLHRNETST